MRIPVILGGRILKLIKSYTTLCGEKVFFMATFFVVESVYNFHQIMLVLNIFSAILEGLNLKIFRGSSMPPDPPR